MSNVPSYASFGNKPSNNNVPSYASFGNNPPQRARGAPRGNVRGNVRGAPRGNVNTPTSNTRNASPSPVPSYASFGGNSPKTVTPPNQRGRGNVRGAPRGNLSPNRGTPPARGNMNRGAPVRGRGNVAVGNRGPSVNTGTYATQQNMSSSPSYNTQQPGRQFSPKPSASASNSNLYSTQPVMSGTRNTGPKEHRWSLVLESGTNLIAADVNGKSDPYVKVELVTATKSNGKWSKIKTNSKTKTPTIQETLNPVWNFQVYNLKAEVTFLKYQGVKLSCYDKDLVGSDDFLGEAYLWFGENVPNIPTTKKNIKIDLQSRPKKKDKVRGYLTVSSIFTDASPATNTQPQRQIKSQKSNSNIAARAVQRSDLVQVGATGRREVTISTTGVEKYVSFGELPALNMKELAAGKTKEQKKYGFNPQLALWLVTCCTLAYKKEEIVKAVCCDVWDMCGFKFIDDKVTDTQGFCMYNQEFLVVCFRGTESIRDWMTNLNFVQVATTQFPQRYLKSGVKVHNGFNEALKSVWPDINDFVCRAFRSYPHLKLFICGHSLGGALANLCFGYFVLSDKPVNVEAVYTIGQPRAGNKKYREQLEVSSPNTAYIRITNNQDCVPSLAGGQHCGVHVHFDATGRLTFDPPVWKKAVQKAQSIQGSAASMSYDGIADHSGPVYRKLIEGHWVKAEFSNLSSNDGSFNLCERILYVMDLLQEDVKAVRRYKIQFRALLGNILLCRPIIVIIEDFLAAGIDSRSRTQLKNSLVKFFELLSKTRKEVVARHSKKSMLQSKNAKSSLKSFNENMTKLSTSFHTTMTTMDSALQRAKCETPKQNPYYTWAAPPPLPHYDASLFRTLKFTSTDFASMGTKVNKGQSPHVSQILEEAEVMVETGKTEQALKVLTQLDSGSGVIGQLSDEDKALAAFLKAKAHAKLHHHKEACQALAAASGTGMMNSNMMQDAAFGTLKNDAAFNQLQQQWGRNTVNNTPQAVDKLNNFELHMLSDLFDEADDNGDNFLTTEELNGLLKDMGGIENILDNLGWIDKPGKDPNEQRAYQQMLSQKNNLLSGMMNEMRTKYRNAVDLDQFVLLMSRFAP